LQQHVLRIHETNSPRIACLFVEQEGMDNFTGIDLFSPAFSADQKLTRD